MHSTFASAATAAIAASQVVGAFDLNVNDASSVKSAASSMAKNLWSYYKGDSDASQVGLLPKPYYWWEAGAMFGTMISYSYLTGDHTYDKDVAAAIYSQASPTDDFMMMTTQAFDLGNDDQAFWALSAMSAAEHGLVAPEGQSSDIWLKLASGAFNDLIGRYNTSTCGGGIKWQFQTTNNGYNYKSSIANGATMQLGARLALLTGNQTYADKASMVFEWMQAVGFVSSEYQVFDGAGDVPDNCTKINRDEWSYNVGALLGATAAMAKYSEAKNPSDVKTWTDRATGLWTHASSNFFKNDVLYEQPCEGVNTCDTDQYSFKAYLARWATFAGQIVPSLQKDITSKLQSTATAIAKSCTGNGGFACGTQWYNGNFNNNAGVGQEMSGLEVVVGLLGPSVPWGTASGSSSSSSSSAAPTSSSAPKSTSSAAPAKTTMATSTTAAAPSAATLNVVPASGVKPAGSQASNAASNGAASSNQPVMINEQGIPYNTKPVA